MAVDPNNPFLPQVAAVASATPGAAVDPNNPFLPGAPQGLGDQMHDILLKHGATIDAIQNNPTLNPVEKVIQPIGETAGVVNDALSTLLNTGIKAIPQPIKNIVSSIPAQAIVDPASAFGNADAGVPQVNLGQVAQGVGAGIQAVAQPLQQIYKMAEQANPNLTHDVGSLTQSAATFLPIADAVNAAKGGIEGLVKGATEDSVPPVAPPPDDVGGGGGGLPADSSAARAVANSKGLPVYTSDALRAEGTKAFDYADSVGGKLSANDLNSFIDNVSGPKNIEGIGEITNSSPLVDSIVSKLQDYRDQPLTLRAAQGFDSGLTRMIDGETDNITGKLSPQGADLYNLQTKFRNMIADATPNQIEGGPQGFEAWQQGKQLWAKQARQGDIERLVARSSGMQQPANSMRSALNSLATNPNRMRGFSPAEQAAIQDAAKPGIISDAVSTLGSRLVPIVSGATGGGLPGYIAGTGISGAARKVAQLLQDGKVTKIMQLISQDGKFIPPEIPAPPAPGPQLMLPAPAQDVITNPAGVSQVATPTDQAAMIGRRQEAAQLGMTPDIYGNIARNDLRARIGPDWDVLDAQKQQAITDQVNQMWKQNATPLSDVLDQAKQSAQDLAEARGQSFQETTMSQAFQQAVNDFEAKKALRGIGK